MPVPRPPASLQVPKPRLSPGLRTGVSCSRVAGSSPATLPRVLPGPLERTPDLQGSQVLPVAILNFLPPRRLFEKGPSARGPGGRSPARRQDSYLVSQLVAVRVGDAGGGRRELRARHHTVGTGTTNSHTKGFYTKITLQCSAFSRKTLKQHWARLQDPVTTDHVARASTEQTRGPAAGAHSACTGCLDTKEGTEHLLEKNTTHDKLNFTLL